MKLQKSCCDLGRNDLDGSAASNKVRPVMRFLICQIAWSEPGLTVYLIVSDHNSKSVKLLKKIINTILYIYIYRTFLVLGLVPTGRFLNSS